MFRLPRHRVYMTASVLCAAGLAALSFAFDGHADIPGPLTRLPAVESLQSSSVNISWIGDEPCQGAVELIRPDGHTHYPQSQTSSRRQVVTIDGLQPGTRYEYRIILDGQPVTEQYSFITPPNTPDAPVRFFVIGDSGSGKSIQYDIANQIELAVKTRKLDFGLHTGDVIYYDPEEWRDPISAQNRKYFSPYGQILTSTPIWPSVGNHDLRLGEKLHLDAFALPNNERWYSFNYGPLHVVVLDSNIPKMAEQLRWLEMDLIEHQDSPWIAAVMHHPPYSWPYSDHEELTHSSDMTVRNEFCPLLEKYGVDIVFCGHTHAYQRSQLIRDYDPHGDGIYYIVTGGGGARLHPVAPRDTEVDTIAFEQSDRYHFAAVEIMGDLLHLDAIDDRGKVFDSFSFTRKKPSAIASIQ